MTPMMQQYFSIKEQYADYLLFYRLGDFYEMFFEDAKTASRELDLTLTGRDCGEAERAPMCGVPFHSAEGYIGRLIEKGYKVAICEQTEDPSQAKGLVRREVIRVITPGTLIESGLLSEQRNNYLCALYLGEDEVGIGFADASTGQISATSVPVSAASRICTELGTYSPSEVICNLSAAQMGDIADFVRGRLGAALGDGQTARFDYDEARERCSRQFAEILREGMLDNRAVVSAVGALISYIAETQKIDIAYIKELNLYRDGQYLEMDLSTRRNLELTETMRAKEKKGSLLWVLDRTRTAPGARMIRQWIEHPLLSVSAILERQGAVSELHGNYMLREELSELLDSVLDLERLVTKIVYGTANAKDLRAVATTVAILPELKRLLEVCCDGELCRICRELDLLEDICDLITRAIVEDPPFSVREGGMIAEGYSPDVDYLRNVMHDGRSWIERVEAEEREATGIKNLRINYNKVFGYYIEVTKSMLGMVPDRYIRKQTLTNCERYITQELKDMEATILGAADKVCSLEYEIFCEVRGVVSAAADRLQKTAVLLATLDAYLSLATVAARNQYVCPEVDCSDVIEIKDGRHPVVEQFVRDSYFVPNDTLLDTGHNRMMLITGPNMAGKSTYMRQTALIAVMAQIGSFVPAADARVGIVDKLFTRVGASDDLASGQSTFMLEMTECAHILANATRRSLIIYDEVGRGTSTFDGMSIARAIIEYTLGKKIGAKTMFATHYHELTSLEGEFDGVVNYNIAAKKRGDGITFLRKIVRGSTDDSYGIEVAKLAGIPNEVIRRAREVLASIEASADIRTDGAGKGRKKDDSSAKVGGQLTLESAIEAEVAQTLRSTDLNTLSPYEAMTLLFDLKRRLGGS